MHVILRLFSVIFPGSKFSAYSRYFCIPEIYDAVFALLNSIPSAPPICSVLHGLFGVTHLHYGRRRTWSIGEGFLLMAPQLWWQVATDWVNLFSQSFSLQPYTDELLCLCRRMGPDLKVFSYLQMLQFKWRNILNIITIEKANNLHSKRLLSNGWTRTWMKMEASCFEVFWNGRGMPEMKEKASKLFCMFLAVLAKTQIQLFCKEINRWNYWETGISYLLLLFLAAAIFVVCIYFFSVWKWLPNVLALKQKQGFHWNWNHCLRVRLKLCFSR